MRYKVVIFFSNTLMSVGLRHLLSDVFGVSTQCATPEDFDLLSRDADYIISDSITLKSEILEQLSNDQRLILIGSDINYTDDESVIIEKLNKYFIPSDENRSHSSLSQREIEVLRLIAAGRLNKEIANELNISINTVLTHRKNITAKLGIKSVSGLSFYAMMNGIITPSQAMEK